MGFNLVIYYSILFSTFQNSFTMWERFEKLGIKKPQQMNDEARMRSPWEILFWRPNHGVFGYYNLGLFFLHRSPNFPQSFYKPKVKTFSETAKDFNKKNSPQTKAIFKQTTKPITYYYS